MTNADELNNDPNVSLCSEDFAGHFDFGTLPSASNSPVRKAKVNRQVVFSPIMQKFAVAQLESEKEQLIDKVYDLTVQKEDFERDRREKCKEIEKLSELVAKLEQERKSLAHTASQRINEGMKSNIEQAEEVLQRIQNDIELCKNDMKTLRSKKKEDFGGGTLVTPVDSLAEKKCICC
jgi:hypothetical protein